MKIMGREMEAYLNVLLSLDGESTVGHHEMTLKREKKKR
jgi:hypothetical protein